jgi:hypothetical protein
MPAKPTDIGADHIEKAIEEIDVKIRQASPGATKIEHVVHDHVSAKTIAEKYRNVGWTVTIESAPPDDTTGKNRLVLMPAPREPLKVGRIRSSR